MQVQNTAVQIQQLKEHRANYNRHPARQIERIKTSLQKFGQVRSIVVWRGQVLAGHGVRQAALSLGWKTLRADVLPEDYNESLALAFLAADNELSRLSDPDQAALAAILDEVAQHDPDLLTAIGYSDDEFSRLLDSVAVGASGDGGLQAIGGAGSEETQSAPRAPDAIWPSDNDWGIPQLDINRQALSFDQPWAIWGAAGRKSRMKGTWLFYTEDYRYEALWTDPAPVLTTQAVAAVEPNFSCYENMPPAVAIWQIYRKRWIARWWQSQGLRIFVDLNVATNHYGLNQLGIPAGWQAFATRGYTERIDATHQEYAQARQIAGEGVTPLFLVYGGGKAVKAECQANGWLWLAEDMSAANGREV